MVDAINENEAKSDDLQREVAELVVTHGGSIVQGNPEESATEAEELNSLRINDKVYNIATESLNARITELDEKIDTNVSQLRDSIDVKVTQLTFETGIDIGDWEAVIDPDEPVIYERYMNYHDAVAKLSQQIDIMGARTDTLKSSLNEVIEERLTYNGVTFYFKKHGKVLSVIVAHGNSTVSLPTSWNILGTLSIIKPNSELFLNMCLDGHMVAFKFNTTGRVDIRASTTSALWLQGSCSCII